MTWIIDGTRLMMQTGLKTIRVTDLKKGMYVVLSLPWYRHPFLKNEFLIETDETLEKIQALDIADVSIDPTRSRSLSYQAPDTPALPGNETSSAREIVPDVLLAAARDTRMPPEQKAALVWQQSVVMMKNLLEEPTVNSIREAKKGISEVVDLILREQQTLHHLLSITSHDFYTYTHSVSVGVLTVGLCKSLFRNDNHHDIHALGAGFFLHDLGKVRIDNEIINKPGKLSEDEMAVIRRHPNYGFTLLNDTKQLTTESKIIVLQHHERIDGSGYPGRLKSGDIHLYARICAIADVYDALTSDRPYRKKMAPFDALKVMREEMLNHFQKDLFEQFVLLFQSR